MYMKKTIVRRGEEPEILSVERNPKETCKVDFPNHCYAVVSKCYEGGMLAVIRGTNPSLLVDDAGIPLPTEVQKMLRKFKEIPALRGLLEVKMVGPIITEMPVMVYWDEETADGGRMVNSFSLERGFFDKDVYDSHGEHKQHEFYSPNGSYTIGTLVNGVMEKTEGSWITMSDSTTADNRMRS